MSSILRSLFLCLFLTATSFAQTPRVYLKLDGDVSDSSAAGIITSVTSSTGWTVALSDFQADRFGVARRALVIPGSRSLQLVASSLLNDSNQALGLRNAASTNTSFTLSAWIFCTNVSGGYNTVFGNLGTGAGTLHAGLGSNTDKMHFGFDGSDANGATVGIVGSAWHHVAFVYDAAAQTQRIFVNGVPEVTRFSVANTLKAADLIIANWNTTTDATNDFRGRLDDVAVWNVALSGDQILALADSVSPTALPAPGTYASPQLAGYLGSASQWGVREIKGYTLTGHSYGTLVSADRIIRNYNLNAFGGAQKVDYYSQAINFRDSSNGASHNFAGDAEFGTNVSGVDDNNFLMLAKCAVRITVEDDYTFGFRGDDGARLRVVGRQFISSTRLSPTDIAEPAHHGDGLYHPNSGGDTHTLGVVHLVPGDYPLEFTYWEGTGGASAEVFAARGAKTSFDATFRLVGDSATGGLPIVPDPDTGVFTVNGGGTVFVHGGVPANVTLAWSSVVVPSSVTITGLGTVAQNGSQSIVSPATTTTYTYTATYAATTVTRQVTVYVDSPPVISNFAASQAISASGDPLTLSWSVAGATTSLVLQPGNIDVLGLTNITLNPTAPTTYTLEATNVAGTSSATVSVNVGPPPVINTFAVTDSNPLYGAEVVLSWDVSNATTLSISQGVGSVSATGSLSLTPLLSTSYTITAVNTFSTRTSTVSITQGTPIGVDAGGFTVTRYNASTPFPFAGMGYLQSADALIAGTNVSGVPTTVTGVTSINYNDGADGDFTVGNVAFPGGAGSGSNFAIKAVGTLVVNTPGEYTFLLNSDDGGRLRVDGQDVILDDGTHAAASSAGRIALTKPSVVIELVYYNAPSNGGTAGAGVELGWIRPNLQFQLLGTAVPTTPVVRGSVLISEFMAENNNTLLDEDSEASDWIEIWNSTAAPVNLLGYYLTDDALVPGKWAFPTKTLAPNEYLVVFASLKNRTNPAANLHTNFKLSSTGEYLALTKDNGAGGFQVVTEFAPTFPAQREDISYGSTDSEGFIGYMETPTPGFTNAVTYTGFVADTVFSHQRGRYSAPFSLLLSTTTPGATIRYTTDGSTPSAARGTVYSGPVAISATTIVRAAAFKAGWKPTNVDTKSYLFVDDIVSQTASTATALGFPAAPVNGQVFRYGMTLANVTAGGGNLQALKDALAAAPSVCMNTDIGNLVDPATGIYVNPGPSNASFHGLEWERPCSLEYINAAGGSEFQIDCGVRIRGGASRAVTNAKHAFHLYFRGSLYDGDLKYRLFGTGGAAEFNQIDMRCEQNNSWSKDNSTQNALLREEWSRSTQRDMGQPHARDGYFHLYINGIYWGIFNWEERTEADFGATYLGGVKDNFDTVKSAGSSGGYNTEMTDGNFLAWKSLQDQCIALRNDAVSEASRTARYQQMRGLNPNGTPNPAFPTLLDVDNLIDFLLVVFYDGSFDAPMSTFLSNASNNWFGTRDRTGTRGFNFFAHDHEHGMDSTGNLSYNRVGPWGDPTATGNNWAQTWTTAQYRTRETFSKSNPQYLHEFLCYSAEYRQRFADRVQRHCFNGGALTTTKSVARVNAMAAKIDPIIHAEAARWGSSSLHKNTWVTAKNNVLTFINSGGSVPAGHPVLTAGDRASILVQQLRGYQDPIGSAKALFPPAALSAPAFSGAFGGPVTNPHNFSITNPNGSGTLYYTVNGGDPRNVGGTVLPGALTAASPIAITLTATSTVRARVFDGANWSALTEAEYLVGVLASSANLAISKIHYNPASAGDPGDLTEFIEIMNISAVNVDMTNVRFILGIHFTFPTGYLLAPGARVLIVRDLAAFSAAHPSVPGGQIAGVFANNTSLDNGGEQLQLVAASDAIIRDFSYDDIPAWPLEPDGDGPSLVLKRPTTNPDHANPANWRASASPGGNPGANDAQTYSAWASANAITDLIGTGDADADGLSNLTEYMLGSNPQSPSLTATPAMGSQSINVGGILSDYLTLTFTRAIGRDEVTGAVDSSTDLLGAWTPAILVGPPTYNGDGTETQSWRHPQPKTSNSQQFLRLNATRLP